MDTATLASVSSILRRAATLGRWLGPWADPVGVPRGIRRRAVRLPANGTHRAMDVWLYRPSFQQPRGSLLIVPGLHYLGPADPRLDRLCRIFASTGTLVACPFLPDFRRQDVGPGLSDDAERALDVLLEQPDRAAGPVGVFSISFGSRFALELAARRSEVGRLMLFGGFADWRDTVWFCMTGRYRDSDAQRHHDPLNRPVVFRILTRYFEGLPQEELNRVGDAWFLQVQRTWGRTELKEPGALDPIARATAERLSGDSKHLFLQGVGLEPGGDERVVGALDRSADAFSYLDPEPWAAQVSVPTVVAHGRDDDVIPFEHAARLHEMLSGARLHVTGAYSHTGQTPLRELIPQATVEGKAMVGLLDAMARTTYPDGT